MNRVESAIHQGRCLLAVGGKALQKPDVLAELRRRGLPAVALGADPVNPTQKLTADALELVLGQEGGVLVLIEPDAATDGRALGELGAFIKGAAHRPKLYVAARAFNPFALPMSMRLLKMQQIKSRAVDFLSALPVPSPTELAGASAAQKAKPAKEKKKNQIKAPRPIFVGREAETAALNAALSEDGGPIFVTGPNGVGKRWLVEQVLANSDLVRLPDFTFGYGTGHDSFAGRLAITTIGVGDDGLHKALRAKKREPVEFNELVSEALANESLSEMVWVIHGLNGLLDRRNGGFHRESRVEMLLAKILSAQPKLKMIFVAEQAPLFFREGEAGNLRIIAVDQGIAGKELHELYTAWHAPEFERDRFGPISERTHGHPMANQFLAVNVREDGDIDNLLEQPKLLRSSDIADVSAIKRHLKKKVGDLPKEQRLALSSIALFRNPGTAEDLQALGINRQTRLSLLSIGLLAQTPVQDGRRFHVHPLVREHLSLREIEDFDSMATLGEHLLELGRSKRLARGETPEPSPQEALRGATALAAAQEGNRLLVGGRKNRSRTPLPYPDNDAVVLTVRSIMRRKNARLDIARMRVNEGLNNDPFNTDLIIASAELKAAEKGTAEQILSILEGGANTCASPELYHSMASYHLSKSARGKAATALIAGTEKFPENGRLRRRLAGIQLSQNHLEEAVAGLKVARDLEPMMPDTYSMLGEAYTRLGSSHWDDAEEVLTEALRLNPNSPIHLLRHATLLMKRALVEEENQAKMWEQAEERLRSAMQKDNNNPHIQTKLATLILDQSGDLEQAQWLLKQSLKRAETAEALVQRSRLLVRQGQPQEAERLLARAIKKEPSLHAAFAVRGDLFEGQGQIFHAFEAYKAARERSPKNDPARVVYEVALKRLAALIESGHAADVMQAAKGAEPTPEEPGSTGPRRDAGTTTIRRRKNADEDGAETAQAAEPEPAPAAETAQAAEPEPAPAAETAQAAEPEPAPAAETAQAAEPTENAAPVDDANGAESTEQLSQ